MLLQDQILDIQYYLKDFQEEIYSRHQIVNNLNTVIRQVNNILCNMSSDLIKARITLTLVSGAVSLPSDFQAIIKVTDGYNNILRPRTIEATTDTCTFEILSNQLIANQTAVVLTYKQYWAEMDVNVLTAVMPLPDFFKDILTVYTKAMLQNDVTQPDTTMMALVDKVKMLVSSRDKKQMKLKPIFRA